MTIEVQRFHSLGEVPRLIDKLFTIMPVVLGEVQRTGIEAHGG